MFESQRLYLQGAECFVEGKVKRDKRNLGEEERKRPIYKVF